jgi:toxin ParE1/3/4
MSPVEITALAADDLQRATEWYDGQGKLGGELVEAVHEILMSIRENPHRFPIVHRDIHRALLRRFPYGVFFREDAGTIRVVAVVHLRRHPTTWRRR